MIDFYLAEFEWDEGNELKSLEKHNVTNEEAENAMFDPKGKVRKTKHGRYIHQGVTSSGRYLFQIFEFKSQNRIRIISSRDMEKREKKIYKGK